MKTSIFAAIVLVLTGCATVKFYSNPDLTEKSGLKYYTVKPFLQVEKDPVNNSIIKATVIYLPDLVNPQYMVIKYGLSSRKVDLKVTEGSINTIGVATDPKIAETIEGMASLISKSAGAVTDLLALKGIPQAAANAIITEFYEVFMGPEGTSLKKVDFK